MNMNKDRIMLNVARALPRRFLMWCFIVVAAHATTGEYGNQEVGTVSIMDALQRWDR
jgi:hypothetical protein